ncbi:MAG: hypothetical protein HMLKMBBP_00194 [Planctomycetes bacterium]|nr:hypothetical protein [Planctomycetota bacterium]
MSYDDIARRFRGRPRGDGHARTVANDPGWRRRSYDALVGIVVASGAALRGFALFLGGFASVNALAGLAVPAFDANGTWIDARPLGGAALRVVLAAAGAAMAAWAVGLPRARVPAICAAASLAAVTLADAVRVIRLDLEGAVDTPWISLSLVFAALLACVAVAAARDGNASRARLPVVAWAAAAALAFPLLLMATTGTSRYARRADAIVVLGARAYADGRPSTSLRDRVTTACAAWHEGLAPRLVLSGGPGDGDVHETESMRRLAASLGVPPDAIELDPAGLDSRSTVANAAALLGPGARVLVVSHGWHLPRLDLAFERRGLRAYTVPAVPSERVTKTPLFVARECLAWWKDWLLGA